MSNSSSPGVEYTKEVRFAVVMYGGVSLAIYINGIAQELLRLVRATARNPVRSEAPAGTERIYRKLSYLLSGDTAGSGLADGESSDAQSVPPTRFVVDIISGTSAGGINGIFLAKALANGQDMDQLQDLWVREGDIDTLINDKKSIKKPLTLQDRPTSLLNSERMYFELLSAFQGMDRKSGTRSETALSPFVDELDLFVTSTDLQGVVLPIHLSDDVVYERRHRNVLHFVYSSPDVSGEDRARNDFHEQYNPFLSYAARCTSSFPFAFEPMCLCDTDNILNRMPDYNKDDNCKSGSPRWQKFYRDYLDPKGVPGVPFPKRAFGDGGYLDNKPFAYATETLTKRSAPVPVDRKLIYVEPSPEHPEDDVEREQKPDAIDNAVSALLTLPRQETIREDLQRVVDRNRLVGRINRIMAGVDRDYSLPSREKFGTPGDSPAREWGVPEEEIAKLDLAEMAERNGPGYAAYHRLRIASVTDDLAKLVTRVAGFDEDSGYFQVIRNLVQGWRDLTYLEHRDDTDKPTLNEFLFKFDLAYPMRRLNYLRRQIDVLYRLDNDTRKFMKPELLAWNDGAPLRDDEEPIFRRALLREKQIVNDAFVTLRQTARALRARPKSKEQDATSANRRSVREEVEDLAKEITRIVAQKSPARDEEELGEKKPESLLLDYFLTRRDRGSAGRADGSTASAEQTDQELRDRARTFIATHPKVEELFAATAEALKANVIDAKQQINASLLHLTQGTGDGNAPTDRPTDVARGCVTRHYNNFETYDLITYPILYDTDVGEADVVDVIRISPEDAKQLIDERDTGTHKLAGTVLAHFGAFLQKRWRQNDIFWGRLDGAERIISSLIPDHPSRVQLIGEAQAEILCETLAGLGEEERLDLVAESLMRTKSRKAEPQMLTDVVTRLKQNCAHNPELHAKLDALIHTERLRERYLKNFDTQHQVDPTSACRSAARATTVVGKMLEDLSESRRVSSQYAAWIARMGQIFWALVEVAVPRSFPELLFRHFLKLVYFLLALLIALSTILLAPDVQKFALTAFGLTAAIHLAVVLLGDLINSRRRWVNLGKTIGAGLLVIIIAMGVFTIAAILGWDFPWYAISEARTVVQKYTPFDENAPLAVRVAFSAFFFLPFLWAIRYDLRDVFTGEV